VGLISLFSNVSLPLGCNSASAGVRYTFWKWSRSSAAFCLAEIHLSMLSMS